MAFCDAQHKIESIYMYVALNIRLDFFSISIAN